LSADRANFKRARPNRTNQRNFKLQLRNQVIDMNERGRRPIISATAKDLIIICVGAVAVFVLAMEFEVFERFASWAAKHDAWLVDDVVVVLVLLGFAAGVFSWRRWRELRAEIFRRHTAEESLRASEDSYRRIVEQAEEIIYRTDVQGRFLFCNPTGLRILKYSESELLGLNYLAVIRPDQRAAAEAFYKLQLIDNTPSTYYEFSALARDGTVVLVGQNVQLVTENREIVGFQAVARDMTERKRSEEALRQLEEYRNLFQLANDAILVLDVSEGTVLDVNDKACESYGIVRDQFIGRKLRDITRDSVGIEHRIERLRTEGKLQEFEVVHVRPDGSPINFLVNTSLIEYQGRKAILSISRDITERKRAEEALRESEESYHRLVELSPDGILVHRDGILGFVNSAGLRLIGCSSESAIIGKSIFDLLRPEYRELMRERVARLQRGELLPPVEVKVTRLDGSEIDCEVMSVPFTHKDQPAVQVVVRDITERKRAEEALRESQESYQRIVEISPDAIIVHRDGVVEFVNNAGVKMIGAVSKSELIGQSVFYRIPPAYREAMAERVGRLQQGEFPPPIEIKLTRLDDTEIDCEVLSVPFGRGDDFAVQVIARDITRRKRAEQEQNRLQGERDQLLEQLQLQMEFMPIAFLLTDADFCTTYWNPAAERIFGFTKEEVLGTYGHQLIVPPDSQVFVKEMFKRLAAGETLSSSFGDNVTKDGRRITCEWYAAPLKKADGTFVGIMSMAQDMTQQKQAAHSLQEANRRALVDYERLVERIATLGQTLGSAHELTTIFRALRDFTIVSVPCDGIVISLYDEAKGTRRPTYCWVDHTEVALNDLIEIPVRDGSTGRAIKSGLVIIDNDFQRQLQAMGAPVLIGESVEGKEPQSALTAPMTVMGRTFGCVEIQCHQAGAYSNDHAAAMRMAANLAANAVANVNLMERDQVKEEQLRQSQKMDAIGQLAGGVAHDFNNLLTVITGYSELSLKRMAKDDPLRRNIEGITKAGLRAAGLTRQLLAFSRRQMLQAKVLDLNTVVREMDQMLQRLIGEDMDLVTLLKPSLGQIKADPGQLEQVLLNLVVNARDAMPKGGKITIETGHKYLEEAYASEHVGVTPGHFVVLTVSDTGVGMDAETQKRIFDPFFTTKEVGKGTGLGLSTVYGIVKQSEGSIWVYSEVGSGTTFKVYLPRVDEITEADESANGSHDVRGGSETILLVEDEDLVRDMAVESLEQYGYAVISAANGEEGLRLCRDFEGRIDLVITDVVMPGMSGRELAEHIAALRPETSVLYMSGYTDDAIVRHGILEENMSFIQKPFLPDALARKARELLDLPVLQEA
jgi:PAS domain S-box-containing protein